MWGNMRNNWKACIYDFILITMKFEIGHIITNEKAEFEIQEITETKKHVLLKLKPVEPESEGNEIGFVYRSDNDNV